MSAIASTMVSIALERTPVARPLLTAFDLSDRPLTHINKKGRPVSQCPHCRGLRKSRATHVKCDCGDKPHGKEDCAHLDKGDSKREHVEKRIEAGSDHSTVDHNVCCCSHGGRCSCALKKDHLDPVPEIDFPATSHPSSTRSKKPPLSATHSDGSLTVFANGHHKPVHKLNHAAHECGLPYKIPRPHSIHGHSALAQKSMDHLPLARSVEDDSSQFQDSITSAQQEVRLVRSEHGSPGPRSVPSFEQLNGQLPQLDLSYSAYNGNFTSSPMDDYKLYEPYMATPEEPLLSAALSMPPVDWSAFDLDNGTLNAAYSQPPSYASFDQGNVQHPGLTTSSSGEASEVEDLIAQSLPSPEVSEPPSQYRSSSSEQPALESYQLDQATSFVGMPQISALAGSNLENITYDSFFQGATASPAEFEDFRNGTQADPGAFTRHGFTVQDAQKLAHPSVPTEAMGELSLPATRDNNDPLWAASFDEDGTTFVSVDDLPEAAWTS